jgi:hypothetical protein
MAQLRIDFEWWRDPRRRGYQLRAKNADQVEYHPPLSRPNLPKLPGQWGLAYHPYGIRVLRAPDHTPLYVVRVGDGKPNELQAYRPLDCYESLYAEFARVNSPEDVLDFIERFGPLTREGLDARKGELVNGALVHAEAIRELLADSSSGDGRHRLAVIGQANPFAGLVVSLDIDPADTSLRLRLAPASLLDALWLQAVQELSSGATVRQCRHCGHWFETGARTGRRLDAKFCSDKHRIAFNSLKRAKRE